MEKALYKFQLLLLLLLESGADDKHWYSILYQILISNWEKYHVENLSIVSLRLEIYIYNLT